MKNRKINKKGIIFLSIIGLIVIINIIYISILLQKDPFTIKLKENKQINILFMISDKDQLQFLELFMLNPQTKKGGLFFVPPNLATKIEKLNLYNSIAYLYKPENGEAIQQKLEATLDIPIHFYIDLTYDNISRLVDLIEGLEVFISNPIDEVVKDERILLPAGSVTLDGDKIIQYINYQSDIESETEDATRKHMFIKTLLRKLGTPQMNNFILSNKVFKMVRRYFRTNLNTQAIKSLLNEVKNIDTNQFVSQRVQGKETKVEGIDSVILFPFFEGELMRASLKQISETIASEIVINEDTMNIKLEVLNGTPVEGLAERTKILFESYGFDVFTYTNADRDDYNKTTIIDRKNKAKSVERVAEIIKCGSENIRTQLTDEVNADITIILGKDFDGRYCKN
jgi:anionic cell wall polymer biosynthesis LytR-Cps2A-Psr (LCP) family protein